MIVPTKAPVNLLLALRQQIRARCGHTCIRRGEHCFSGRLRRSDFHKSDEVSELEFRNIKQSAKKALLANETMYRRVRDNDENQEKLKIGLSKERILTANSLD